MAFFLFGDDKKTQKRKRLTEDEKFKILERQGHRCAWCGKPLTYGRVHFDHKKPLALGGSDTLRNIQALCPECHHIKTKEDRRKIAEAKKKQKKRKSSFSLGVEVPSLTTSQRKSSSKKSKSSKKKKSSSFDFGIEVPSLWGESSSKRKRKKSDDFWRIW